MILSGVAIHEAVEAGDIRIDPFCLDHLNPASIDLTLGAGVAVYKRWVRVTLVGSAEEEDGSYLSSSWSDLEDQLIDAKQEPAITRYTIGERGWVLKPGIGYLMHTAERIHTNKYVTVIDGKSSIGRLFCKIHETAGYGDPGFDGQYTLEVTVVHPLRLYAGMRIAQARFHTVEGDVEIYEGNYRGYAALGAQPSRAHKQFKPVR